MRTTIDWDSEEWLDSARALIEWIYKVNSTSPVALVVRHSHRATIADYEEMVTGGLTEIGKMASLEMGRRLPRVRESYIYTSIVPRSAETAEYIAKGITEAGGTVIDIEPVATLMGPEYSDENVWANLQPDGTNVTDFVNRWANSEFGDRIESFDIFFSRLSSGIIDPLRKSNNATQYIHVTHDLALMSLKRGLFRRPLSNEDREPYLGGIGLTYNGSQLIVFEGHNRRTLTMKTNH